MKTPVLLFLLYVLVITSCDEEGAEATYYQDNYRIIYLDESGKNLFTHWNDSSYTANDVMLYYENSGVAEKADLPQKSNGYDKGFQLVCYDSLNCQPTSMSDCWLFEYGGCMLDMVASPYRQSDQSTSYIQVAELPVDTIVCKWKIGDNYKYITEILLNGELADPTDDEFELGLIIQK